MLKRRLNKISFENIIGLFCEQKCIWNKVPRNENVSLIDQPEFFHPEVIFP